MHKIWVYKSNDKLHPIEMKIDIHVRPYRTCNLMVEFSKYELSNKLLGGVIFFKITWGVTWNGAFFILIY